MFRRMVLTAALTAGLLAPVFANEQASFILTNGQKHTGTLVYGRDDQGLFDGNYHVGDMAIPMSQVAVIEFVGGAPSAAEAAAVQSGSRAFMVMRDGRLIPGEITNIVNGDFVQWVPDGAARQNYPISQVARIYLNLENARTTFLRSNPAAAGTSGQSGQVTPIGGVIGRVNGGVNVRVDGNQQWVDSTLDVRRGDRVTVNASGNIDIAPGTRTSATGARSTNAANPMANLGSGALIARVGNGAPFAVGAGSRTLTMPEDGRLFFGINDASVNDNSGSYTVSVRVGR